MYRYPDIDMSPESCYAHIKSHYCISIKKYRYNCPSYKYSVVQTAAFACSVYSAQATQTFILLANATQKSHKTPLTIPILSHHLPE